MNPRLILLIMDETRHVEEIASSVYWVGVKDWDRKMFDALIPLPQGTSYNSYLIKGREKTTLIDTVNPGFWNQLHDKVSQIADFHGLDYLVMNTRSQTTPAPWATCSGRTPTLC
jgi:flavorubredoxin